MNKKYMPWLRSLKVRAAFLVATFIFLSLLFLSPPVKLADEEYKTRQSQTFAALDESTRQYLKVEHQKVNDEIRLRTEAQDSWFHYKFILTGGMVALLLGQIGFGHFGSDRKEQPAAGKSRDWMETFFISESAYLILALSCVVSFIIDMHIRSQSLANQRLGLWVANYVEPSYVTPAAIELKFQPWEQFLRVHNGTWLDFLYRFAYGLHLHYMTIFIYLLYSLLLQGVCIELVESRKNKSRKNDGRKLSVVVGCVFVLLSAFAFAVVSHSIPGTAVMRLLPLRDIHADGLVGTLYYSIPLPFLAALHLPYLSLVRNPKRAAAPRA